jgi:hypothetical protein
LLGDDEIHWDIVRLHRDGGEDPFLKAHPCLGGSESGIPQKAVIVSLSTSKPASCQVEGESRDQGQLNLIGSGLVPRSGIRFPYPERPNDPDTLRFPSEELQGIPGDSGEKE